MPRSYRKVHKELVQLRKSYHDFLTESQEPLTMGNNLKLINEISRIDRRIKEIEKMTMIQLEVPAVEWEFQENSLMNFKAYEYE